MSIKYPRTFHLPWSEGATSDDKVLKNVSAFLGKRVVITEKMDGENTTIHRNGYHARSLDSRYHPSRSRVAALQAEIGHQLVGDERICGENLFARHSIAYGNLEDFFLMFSAWDGNTCLAWDETHAMAEMLGLELVPTLYIGKFSMDVIKTIQNNLNAETQEGYVVRLFDSFSYEDFGQSVAKFVRKGHVQTDKHWMHQEMIKNKLKSSIF